MLGADDIVMLSRFVALQAALLGVGIFLGSLFQSKAQRTTGAIIVAVVIAIVTTFACALFYVTSVKTNANG